MPIIFSRRHLSISITLSTRGFITIMVLHYSGDHSLDLTAPPIYLSLFPSMQFDQRFSAILLRRPLYALWFTLMPIRHGICLKSAAAFVSVLFRGINLCFVPLPVFSNLRDTSTFSTEVGKTASATSAPPLICSPK